MDSTLWTTLGWAAQATADQQQGFPPQLMLAIVVIMGLFYFLILRPQRVDQRKRDQMIDLLAKGDQVITAGGIHGTVESIDKQKGIVALNVAPKITMRFNRTAITTVDPKKGKTKADEEPEAKA